ncbi:MAG: hypothetical protein AAB459_03975 [Patescibacteria group bacterium]
MFGKNTINLCDLQGHEAMGLLYNKLKNPKFSLSVGEFSVSRVVAVEHLNDGRPIIEVTNDTGEIFVFSFDPNPTDFAETAVDSNDRPFCLDCD